MGILRVRVFRSFGSGAPWGPVLGGGGGPQGRLAAPLRCSAAGCPAPTAFRGVQRTMQTGPICTGRRHGGVDRPPGEHPDETVLLREKLLSVMIRLSQPCCHGEVVGPEPDAARLEAVIQCICCGRTDGRDARKICGVAVHGFGSPGSLGRSL